MTGNILQKIDERTADSIHKVSRTASAVAEAMENCIETAKRVGKRGSDATEELMDDTVLRVKRHPVETVVAAFALGVVIGGFADWFIRRK
jgi:ElaB/YqjD/DUF883 family membrane-anchored ribosome-binding protein